MRPLQTFCSLPPDVPMLGSSAPLFLTHNANTHGSTPAQDSLSAPEARRGPRRLPQEKSENGYDNHAKPRCSGEFPRKQHPSPREESRSSKQVPSLTTSSFSKRFVASLRVEKTPLFTESHSLFPHSSPTHPTHLPCSTKTMSSSKPIYVSRRGITVPVFGRWNRTLWIFSPSLTTSLIKRASPFNTTRALSPF